jgi:hypothetical protein
MTLSLWAHPRAWPSFGLLLLVSCTVAPKLVTPQVPSWDGARQDSGVIAQLPDRSFIVTPTVIEKFRSLCPAYGAKVLPPCGAPFGYAPTATNTFILSPGAFSAYAQMMSLWEQNQATK